VYFESSASASSATAAHCVRKQYWRAPIDATEIVHLGGSLLFCAKISLAPKRWRRVDHPSSCCLSSGELEQRRHDKVSHAATLTYKAQQITGRKFLGRGEDRRKLQSKSPREVCDRSTPWSRLVRLGSRADNRVQMKPDGYIALGGPMISAEIMMLRMF
jgi:hypothetical protein